VPVEVLETPLADAQVALLRGPAARAYQAFLDDLAARGCAALGYRVTGPIPLERLCVKHLRGEDRVVVAFESDTRAWVLLVGAHGDDNPRRNFYDELYRLAGVRPPADQRRRKPPCCDDDDRPPELDETAVAELVDRARELLRDNRKPREHGRVRSRPGRRRR
jgi:hypothetical protein